MQININPWSGKHIEDKANNLDLKLALSEGEKYEDDKSAVKKLFDFYLRLGYVQIMSKKDDVENLYHLVNSIPDVPDYVEADNDFVGLRPGMEKMNFQEVKIEFYGILPVIHKGLLGTFDKMFRVFTTEAVNPENTNAVLDELDSGLRDNLIRNIELVFQRQSEGLDPEVMKQRHEMLLGSQRYLSAMKKSYRTQLESWANQRVAVYEEKYKMKSLHRKVLEQVIVTADPVVHVNFDGSKMKPEVLDEGKCFSINSDDSKTYADSQVFGWIENKTLVDILYDYGKKMEDSDFENLNYHLNTTYGAGFDINTLGDSSPAHNAQRSTNNYKAFMGMVRGLNIPSTYMYNLATIYFYVLRKVGKATFMGENGPVVEFVDENFQVPKGNNYYKKGESKTAENLVKGVHVDWFWVPDLWRGRKIVFNPSLVENNSWANGVDLLGSKQGTNADVWLELDRFDFKMPDEIEENRCKIPVFGGPESMRYGKAASIVKTAKPTQVLYTWLYNRIKAGLETEIGKFAALNNAMIPNDNIDGDMDNVEPIVRFAENARDVGIAGTANPVTQSGVGALGVQQAVQTIDLTRHDEVLGKLQIAEFFKRECLASVGLTPEYLYGNIAPSQNASTAAIGGDRSSTQIQYVFTRADEVMCEVLTQMLTFDSMIASKNPSAEMVYTGTEGQREIWKFDTTGFDLAKFNIFTKSNASDVHIMEQMKQYILTSNTLGLDAEGVAQIMRSKVVPEVVERMKEMAIQRSIAMEEEHSRKMELLNQEAKIRAQELEEERRYKSGENALDREAEIMGRQISALGYGNSTAGEIADEVLKLRTANEQQQQLYARQKLEVEMFKEKQRSNEMSRERQIQDAQFKRQVELEKLRQSNEALRLRDKDIEARSARTKVMD